MCDEICQQQKAGGYCGYSRSYGYHRQRSSRDEIIQVESNTVVKIRWKRGGNNANSIVKKTLKKLHPEYCIQFRLALFSESPQTGTGAVKRCPGKLWGMDSPPCKTWEEFQQSKGWESLRFLSINTVGGQEGKRQTIQLDGQADPKISECKLAINRPSPEIRGKFLVTTGMTKEASHRGRQQQMLPIFGMRCM